jgi:alkyl sulfatase BDS1-like metallo-beta-lactamase superfamily hydrolase
MPVTRIRRRLAAPPLALAVLAAAWLGCERGRAPDAPPSAPPSLAEHSREFERAVIEVTDGVHVAVGFGLANSILVEGSDGVVVVDTMESVEAARAVQSEFARITSKPVRAIVYTHNHTDHVFGARAFATDPASPPPVYAHETTSHYIDRVVNVIRPAIYTRSMRMFGNYLPPGGVVNAGIGPFLATGHGGGTLGLLRPSHTFAERLELEIAGVRLELVHAPGETDDQIFVWLPDERVLLPGDNFYRSFPNLYTIRGTPHRDLLQWVASLDAMRDRRPEHLVPSHTRPLSGADRIQDVLTDYRDAIQFVHDQTVRGMNRGLTPDELVETVRLPDHLAASPFLQEFYGTVEWSVRSVFTGYLGWFGGDAARLSPLAPDVRARRMAELAETSAPLLEHARRALEAGDAQWAAELASHAVRAGPDEAEATRVAAAALRALGEAQRSANVRHYLLTQALELEGAVEIREADPSTLPRELIESFPIAGFLRSMSVNLDPERSADVDRVVGFRFPDTGEEFTLHVRRGVAEVRPRFPREPEISVRVDTRVWKEILVGVRSPAVAFASGDVEVEGSTLDLVALLRLFAPG